MSSPKPSYSNAALLIFGAGGHGRVVADAAMLENRWAAIVSSDRNTSLCQGELLPSIPMRSPEEALSLNPVVHIAIGANRAREKEAELWGFKRLICIFHPASTVSRFSNIAAGCFVAAGAVIGPSASLGLGVIINHGAVIDHDVQIGAFSHIAPNATLGGGVTVGQRVLIGAGAVVMPSMTIVDDVIVGAGAVVCAHLVQAGTYAGIPARKIA